MPKPQEVTFVTKSYKKLLLRAAFCCQACDDEPSCIAFWTDKQASCYLMDTITPIMSKMSQASTPPPDYHPYPHLPTLTRTHPFCNHVLRESTPSS